MIRITRLPYGPLGPRHQIARIGLSAVMTYRLLGRYYVVWTNAMTIRISHQMRGR